MGDGIGVGEEGAMGSQAVEERRGRRADDLLEGAVLLDHHDQVAGCGGALPGGAGGVAAACPGERRQQRHHAQQSKRPSVAHGDPSSLPRAPRRSQPTLLSVMRITPDRSPGHHDQRYFGDLASWNPSLTAGR